MSTRLVLDEIKAWCYFTWQKRLIFDKILRDMDWNGYILTEVCFERLAKAVNPNTEPIFSAIRETYSHLQSLVTPLKSIFMLNAPYAVPYDVNSEERASSVKKACIRLWKVLSTLLSMSLGEIMLDNITMIKDIWSRIKDLCENQLIPLILEAKGFLERLERVLDGGTYNIQIQVVHDVEDEHGAREEGEEVEGNETETGSGTEEWSEIQEEDGLEEEVST